MWCPEKAEFTYSTTLEVTNHAPTMRIGLRAVMSLFDPFELLIQDIWRPKPTVSGLYVAFSRIVAQKILQLYVLVDASEESYTCAAFFRAEYV